MIERSLANAEAAPIRSRLATSLAVGPVMALAMRSINAARAGTVTVLFQEVGSDVQTTISGSLGLSGLAYQYDTQNFDAYMSFAAMGLTPGIYTWTMGSDSVVMLVGVPEPSTCATARAGLACGGFSMWRVLDVAASPADLTRTGHG